MTVNTVLPVSVSIAADVNPVCAGALVTFTATPTNGGTTPAYQWAVNGANVGTNSPTYTSTTLVNGDVVTCVLTSNGTCVSGSPATSNTITMVVNPGLPVSVSIAADVNSVCAGTLVTFTATPTNGGTTPTYQWAVNGTNAGTNSVTFASSALVNGDLVTCVVTSNATCATGSPATSNTVTMVINPGLPVSIAIAADVNPVCVGALVTFTATPTNGGTTPAYQWAVNGSNVGTNSVTFASSALVNGDLVTCVLTSNATCVTGSPATSNTITMVVNSLPTVTFTAQPGATASVATNVIYTTQAGMPNYIWTFPGTSGTDFTIISGGTATSNTVTLQYLTTGSKVVTVNYTNANGCSATTATSSTATTVGVYSTITITPTDVHKTYGAVLTGPASSTAFTFTGTLLPGDNLASVTLNYGTGAPAAAAIGTYSGSVTPSAATGTFNPANYTIVYAAGNLIVDPAVLTITASNVTKNFGTAITGAAGSTAFTTVGLQNGQTIGSVTVAYGTGALATDPVGTYTGQVTASAATGGTFTAGNYTITYVAGNIIVSPAGTLTITATNVTKTYGTAITGGAASTAFTAVGLLNGETIGSVTIAYGTGALATAAVGTYTGSVTPSAATGGTFNPANYTSIVYTAGNIVVNPIALTITANNATKNFGTALTGGAGSTAFTSVGLQNGETIGSVTIAYGTGALATDPVGTYTGQVNASVATGGTFTAGNYTITYVAGNIIVSQAGTLTITATNVTKTYGTAITGGAGSTAFTAVGLLNGETIGSVTVAYGTGSAAAAAIGTYTGSVTPSAATGGTFNPANYTSIVYTAGNIIVNPAALTITANNVNKNFGTAITGAAGSTAFTSVGLQNGQTIGSVTVAYGTGAAANAAVGTYTGSVTATAATGGTFAAGNYTISYVAGNIIVNAAGTLTITATNVTKTYGTVLTGGTGSTAFTAVGLLNGETIGSVTIAYGTGAAGNAAVGTYTGSVTPSAATGGTFNAANYTSIVYVAGNIVVNPVALTITANNATKNFGTAITGGAGSTAFTSVGLQNGETIGSVTIAYGTGAAANAPVGTYTGSVTASAATGGTLTAANYTITYVAGNVIVTPSGTLTITATNVSKTYGTAIAGGTGSTAFTAVGLLNGETIGSVTMTYGTGSAAAAAVGTYTGSVTPSAATGGTFTPANYNIVYVSGNIVVNPASLAITASDVHKSFGSALTGGAGSTAFTSVGLQNGQTIGSVTIAYGTGAGAAAAVGAYSGSVVASAPTGGTFNAANYSITYTNGTIFVDPAGTLTIVAKDFNKLYGDVLSGATGSADFTAFGLVNGESVSSVTIAFGTGAAGTASVGTYYGSVTVSNPIGTFNPANYTTINLVSGNIIVGKRPLTITAVSQSHSYGTTLSGDGPGSTAFTSSGLQNGETISTVSIAYGTGKLPTAAVGTYPGSVVVSSGIGTFNSANYSLTYVNGDIIVTPAQLTITAKDVVKNFGHTLTNNPVSTAFTTDGLQNGETIGTVSIVYGNGADPSAASGTYSGQVGISGAINGTFNASNYQIVYVPGTIFVGLPPWLTVTAENKIKCVDGTVYPASDYTVTFSGFTDGDTPTSLAGSLTISGSAKTATDTGNYIIVPGGFSSEKYSFIYVNGTLTINPGPTVTITNPSVDCAPATVDLTQSGVTAGSSPGLTFTYWKDAGATIDLATPAAATSGTYYIKGTTAEGCYTVKPVVVTVNPAPIVNITNPDAVCTPSTVNLTTNAVTAGSSPGLNFTYWTDSGATMTLGTPSAVTSGTYYIKGTSLLGCYTIQPVTARVNPIPVPVIEGKANPCIGETQIYTTEAGRTGYEWMINGGGQITAGGSPTDSTVTVKWNVGGTHTISVNYSNGSNCRGTAATVKNIVVTDNPAAAGVIQGSNIVCASSQGLVYTVPQIANATSYAWTIPSTVATIVSGEGTSSITLNFAANAESGNISVSGVGCNNGTPSTLAVEVAQKPESAGSISGEHTFSKGTTGAVYTVDPIANATNYNWSLPAGATIVSGANTDSITVDFGPSASAGVMTVYGSNVATCPNGAPSPDFVLEIPGESYSVYPVPSNGIFTISLTFPTESTFDVNIYNNLGLLLRTIYNAKTVGGIFKEQIDLSGEAGHFYFIEFINPAIPIHKVLKMEIVK